MAFTQNDRGLCPRTAALLLTALACLLAGCASELAQQERPDEEWSAYQRALHTWNPSYGEEFLAQFPNSPYAQRVREQTEELKRKQADRPAYEPYLRADSKEGYEEFIAKYPNNYFVAAAKDRLADLEFAPYRNQDTIQAYRDFLSRYPSHKHTQLAKQHLEELTTPPQHKKAAVVYHPSEILVTTGPLSQPYEALGSVHADTVGGVNFGAALNDAFFRSPLAASIQASPKASTEEMNRMLREKAREQYGGRVDAVINVTYRTEPRGNVFADGLAVHFTPQPPPPASAPPVRSTEERLKEIRGLLDQGLITQGEYERKRLEILKEL